MSDKTKPFLICYDICDPKRLRRVHKTVRDVAMPVQFSVFWAELKASELDALLAKLKPLLKLSEDKVNIYPLAAAKGQIGLGKPPLSGGVLVF